MLGGCALPNRRLGMSHYDVVRGTARERADTATEDLRNLYGRVPANDLPATFAALREQQLDTRGAVRSSLAPDVAVQLGIPIEWRAMTPEQFNAVMTWIGEDPARLSSITGSGDIGYLNRGASRQVAARPQAMAQALIARELGLPVPIAHGLPANYDESYYTSAADIMSAAANERALQQARQAWAAAHPGVMLDPWSPVYLGREQALINAAAQRPSYNFPVSTP